MIERQIMHKIAPSILSADFSRLGEEVQAIEKGGAHFIHVDVMDGHFVPNISFGSTVMKSLLGKTNIPFDVHLMIETPERYLKDFVTSNTAYITVHWEACPSIEGIIDQIHGYGLKAGISINPDTDVKVLLPLLEQVDMILIMSVFPGFGGQAFIPSALEKIQTLRDLRNEKGLSFEIEVDGGITPANVHLSLNAGADIIVAGSSIFNRENVEQATREFVNIATER
jgi:ribulose-phosphate 3-epimerase